MTVVSGMMFSRNLLPYFAVKWREECIAAQIRLDLCKIKSVSIWHPKFVHVGSSNNKQLAFACKPGYFDSFIQRVNEFASGCMKFVLPRHDNVRSVRQGPEFFRNGIIIPASHDDMMFFGGLHEVLHVIGKMPGEGVALSNYMVAGQSGDEGDEHGCQLLVTGCWFDTVEKSICI